MIQSHYYIINSLFEAIEESDLESITDIVDFRKASELDIYDEEVERFAKSLLFLLVSMKAGMQPEAWKEFRERINKRTVNMEIDDMFWEEDD